MNTETNFMLGIAGALMTALLIGVGATLWRLTGKVQTLEQLVKTIKEDLDELKKLVEQGRKWRWESKPHSPFEDK